MKKRINLKEEALDDRCLENGQGRNQTGVMVMARGVGSEVDDEGEEN